MRTIYKILLLTFKAQIGKSPVYLSELVHQYAPTRSLRSSQQSLLATSTRTSTKFYGQRSFSFAASNLWNNLPVHIRQANSVNHAGTCEQSPREVISSEELSSCGKRELLL